MPDRHARSRRRSRRARERAAAAAARRRLRLRTRRRSWRSRPAISCACRWARARSPASSGARPRAMSQPRKLKRSSSALDAPPLARGAAALHRLGGELHAVAAGRGAAHGDERARRADAAARRSPACADRGGPRRARRRRRLADAGAPARARRCWPTGRRCPPPISRARRRAAPAWCARWPRQGLLEPVALPRRAAPPQPDWRRPGRRSRSAQRAAADALVAAVGAGRLLRDAARRRHRLGQDRGLFRRDRRGARARASRCWCCCRRSRSRRNGSRASPSASARRRSNGIPISAQAARRDAWRAVAEGKAPVVVGARSALFLPFADLGLIVVDEEQDPSFKQEDGVIYHARDMAVVRASLAKLPIVLVSATPSLETMVNVAAGPLSPSPSAGAPRRGAAARDPRHRHAPRAAASASASSRRRWSRRSRETLDGGRAGDAVPQPPRLCAADPVPRLRPSPAMPQLHRLAGRASLPRRRCNAIIAAITERAAAALSRIAARPASFAPAAPASSGCAEEVAARFPAARLAVMASDTLTGPRAVARADATRSSSTTSTC